MSINKYIHLFIRYDNFGHDFNTMFLLLYIIICLSNLILSNVMNIWLIQKLSACLFDLQNTKAGTLILNFVKS